jgi:hypothetical protein
MCGGAGTESAQWSGRSAKGECVPWRDSHWPVSPYTVLQFNQYFSHAGITEVQDTF